MGYYEIAVKSEMLFNDRRESQAHMFHKDFSIPLMKKNYETSACGEIIGTLFDKSSYIRREV